MQVQDSFREQIAATTGRQYRVLDDECTNHNLFYQSMSLSDVPKGMENESETDCNLTKI